VLEPHGGLCRLFNSILVRLIIRVLVVALDFDLQIPLPSRLLGGVELPQRYLLLTGLLLLAIIFPGCEGPLLPQDLPDHPRL
jgi:hypothetical protein